MFYEKLLEIYRNSGCYRSYPLLLLDDLSKFVLEYVQNNKKLISPYKFALQSNIEVREAVQFFMYFTQKDGLFKIRFFFDCTRINCGHRIFIPEEVLRGPENVYVSCPDCEKEYLLPDVIHVVKAYFEIKQEFFDEHLDQHHSKRNVTRSDPNSTVQALHRMPDHLKDQSPSSSIDYKNQTINDEGDNPHIAATTIIEMNKKPDGEPINEDFLFLSDITYRLY